jgi:hypothetical protein
MTQKRHAATRSFAGPRERAAERPGFAGDAALAYARDVVAADFEEAGDGDIVRKVLADLRAKDLVITEQAIRAKMNEHAAQALAQVKAKRKDKNFAEWAHLQRFPKKSSFSLAATVRFLSQPSGRWSASRRLAADSLRSPFFSADPRHLDASARLVASGRGSAGAAVPAVPNSRFDRASSSIVAGVASHDARTDPKILPSKLGSNDFSAAPISVKSGLFETLQHVVVRRLRIELRGEPLSV